MLRRLDLRGPWRSLDRGFWPDDQPLGRHTVIYGHNGSGKSTLADLLLAMASGESSVEVIWEDEEQRRSTIAAGGPSPSPSMAVFTKKWVESNLSAFLDGEHASAIVTLGQEAIHAKEEETQLAAEIEQLQRDIADAKKEKASADQKVDELARDAQDEIVSQLQVFDQRHFTRSRYSMPRVKEDLRRYEGEFPDTNAHALALERLGEGVLAPVAEVAPVPSDVVGALSGLDDLLAQTPTRVALTALDANPVAQTWVERGTELHAELEECLFCGGALHEERRRRLTQHFDESWLTLRAQAQTLLGAVQREKADLEGWVSSLPAVSVFASDFHDGYRQASEKVAHGVDARVEALRLVEGELVEKSDDPSATPQAPDWSALRVPVSATGLTQAVAGHNDQVRRHAEVTSGHKKTVLDRIFGSRSTRFRELEEQAAAAKTKSDTSVQAASDAQRDLDDLRQKQFSSSAMAETLTRDLARVYGKHHLSIAVTDDGKSYTCRRGDGPATDLSEGERTTLSLLYFLRKLQDESHTGDSSRRIVVIDDPSSSLDREALFATHQWLIDTLERFGQFVILTHDFGLLRLFVKSQKSAWGPSMKRIREGNLEETRFPKVAFLEMFASSVDGKRRSQVGGLPRLLLNSTSEYAYLFSMVMAGVAASEDHERLFLLPNAARRVLEVFASYKAPHLPQFDQQLKSLIEATDGDPYRDVYDFCNRYSHGEGSESVDVLDARAVHGQIRRCVEFLKAADAEHFSRMCRATNTDERILA